MHPRDREISGSTIYHVKLLLYCYLSVSYRHVGPTFFYKLEGLFYVMKNIRVFSRKKNPHAWRTFSH
jgi:hypothetical protein